MHRAAATSPAPSSQVLVLYDGDCGICTRSARWLARLDGRGRLAIEPLQSAEVFGAPPRDELLSALHVRGIDDRWHHGGDAVLTALDALPGWRILSRLVRGSVLRRLVEPAYRLVARNRGGISRHLGVQACPTPGAAPVDAIRPGRAT